MKANAYAREKGKTPFSIYQGAWSILQRDFEREIIPMARAEGTRISISDQMFRDVVPSGLALAPWRVLASGKIRTDEEEERRRQSGEKGTYLSFSTLVLTQFHSPQVAQSWVLTGSALKMRGRSVTL